MCAAVLVVSAVDDQHGSIDGGDRLLSGETKRRAPGVGLEDLRPSLQCPADRVLMGLVEWGSEKP